MSSIGRKSALIPYQSASGALMILIVAAITFLAVFALATSLSAARVANSWTEGLTGAATVRIEAGEEDRARRVTVVLEILRGTQGVLEARPLQQDDISGLLEPWFGSAPDLGELPAPGIIAVTLDPENEPDSNIIQARLDGAGTGAVYDDHGRWRKRAAEAATSVRWIALSALLLAAIAVAAVVFLVVRVGMSAHRETISALRMAGAEDGFIAGLYQRRYFWLGLLGGVLGTALAIGFALGFDALSNVSLSLPSLTPPAYWPVAMVTIVGFTAIVAVVSARIAVMTALRMRA